MAKGNPNGSTCGDKKGISNENQRRKNTQKDYFKVYRTADNNI